MNSTIFKRKHFSYEVQDFCMKRCVLMCMNDATNCFWLETSIFAKNTVFPVYLHMRSENPVYKSNILEISTLWKNIAVFY